MLFFVVLSVFLPCLPIFFSDCCNSDCVSADQSSRCQWIQGLDGYSSWCSQGHSSSHPEVTGYFRWLLGTPRFCSAIPEVLQACSYGSCLLGTAHAEVAALGLLWQRLLAQACSDRSLCLGPAHLEVPDSCPVLQRSLT